MSVKFPFFGGGGLGGGSADFIFMGARIFQMAEILFKKHRQKLSTKILGSPFVLERTIACHLGGIKQGGRAGASAASDPDLLLHRQL